MVMPLVDVVVGGQFGSEGKGHIVSHLAPHYDLLVRVGGPNAGHTVIAPNGKPYTHHLLPSGTMHSAAQLLIGAGAVLNLDQLLREINECGVGPDRLAIDPRAVIVSAEDIEAEGVTVAAIGSTGQGVGSATTRRISGRNGVNPPTFAGDVFPLCDYIDDGLSVLDSAYRRGDRILLEGTQGTGLSLLHGPWPYVTSRDTAASGTLSEAGIPPGRVKRVIMVCRTYPIRVQSPAGGTSGPMIAELSFEDIGRRSGLDPEEIRATEITSTTRRQRRIGEWDWGRFKRAVLLNAPTDIALTFADYIDANNRSATRYEELTHPTRRFVEQVGDVADCPVSLISTRFEAGGVLFRKPGSWPHLARRTA